MVFSGDAGVDRDDLRFIGVQDIVMVTEQAAQCGSRGPVEAEGFNAGEEPAAELFGVQRCDGAVELDAGLAIGREKESGFIAGEDQVIEGGELSRLMMISWHCASGEKVPGGLGSPTGYSRWRERKLLRGGELEGIEIFQCFVTMVFRGSFSGRFEHEEPAN